MSTTSIQCLGFIMDGNRRWAKEQGVSALAGHQKGSEVFLESIKWVQEVRVPHAVYYAFSTENWKRTEAEVGYLMSLFEQVLTKMKLHFETERAKDSSASNINVRFIGNQKDFSGSLQQLMKDIEFLNESYPEPVSTIWIALSYGGRAEMVEAVNKAVVRGELVTEDSFATLLQTNEMPDPDIIVRTSGEQRLSNFLTWKSVYSELLFIDKHWPALTKDDFKDILTTYESRERRKGV